jgi:hypothetical protein
MSMKHFAIVGIVAATISLVCPLHSLAQPTSLPPRTHAGPTMMSAKAHDMEKRLADEIAKAKSGGTDVTEAEHLKAEGDAALGAGHYRIAVTDYEAAEKALGHK